MESTSNRQNISFVIGSIVDQIPATTRSHRTADGGAVPLTIRTTAEWKNADSICSITLYEQTFTLLQVDLKIDGPSVKDLVLDRTKKRGNFLHLISSKCSEDAEFLVSIIRWTRSTFGLKTFKKMMKSLNLKGQTFLDLIFQHQSPRVIWKFWKWLLEELRKPAEDFAPTQYNSVEISFKAASAFHQEIEDAESLDELIRLVDRGCPNLSSIIRQLTGLELYQLKKIIRTMKNESFSSAAMFPLLQGQSMSIGHPPASQDEPQPSGSSEDLQHADDLQIRWDKLQEDVLEFHQCEVIDRDKVEDILERLWSEAQVEDFEDKDLNQRLEYIKKVDDLVDDISEKLDETKARLRTLITQARKDHNESGPSMINSKRSKKYETF